MLGFCLSCPSYFFVMRAYYSASCVLAWQMLKQLVLNLSDLHVSVVQDRPERGGVKYVQKSLKISSYKKGKNS